MRSLTIKRDKNFVASLSKVKVYIEDAASFDLTICSTPCRLLGTLKNGEEKTFEISEAAAKVYVIYDKLSKDYCNDCYILSAGQEPVSLSGCCTASGGSNAFRFYGNNNPEAEAARKKGGKKSMVISLIACAVILALGIGAKMLFDKKDNAKSSAPAEYTVDNMTITMTKGFEALEVEGYTGSFYCNEVVMSTIQEKFADYEYYFPDIADWSVEEYADLSVSANGNYELKKNGDIPYFEFTSPNELTKEDYYYMASMYKAPDAFWIVQFAVPESEMNEYQPIFLDWAKSVKFK